MGKTKTKIIDDTQIAEKTKEQKPKAPKDSLVASLLEELGEIEPKPEKIKQVAQKKEKLVKKEVKAKPRGKKYQQATKDIEKNKNYPLEEAVELAQKSSFTKFPATMEAHINTNVKSLRGLISLPYASGKKLTILAFPSTSLRTSGLVKELEEMGVIVGDDQIIEEIEKGRINFDVMVTTPEWMSKLAKVAKVLGPKGLMPNPKNGTITQDLKKSVEELQAGKTEYKTEPNGQLIHLSVGKVNQPKQELIANIKILYQTIGKSKIAKITLSPTMGPGIKVDLTSI